jgi:malonyl CoA-acyl carrier protein transacylase
MAHPLTDELCDQIVSSTPPLPCDQQDRVLSYDGRILDGMFEECFEEQKHQFRAVADWQLEQVIKWIEDEGFYDHITYDHHFDYGVQTYVSDFIANLKKAMRPEQQQEEN